MTQTRNPDAVYEMASSIASLEFLEDWISDFFNIALTNEAGDVALFEYVKEGLYTGHYFYNSRGRKALSTSEEFLNEIFSREEVQAIQGFTPLRNRKARWLSRQIGFSSYGVIQLNEPCEHFILTRNEYNQRKEEC